MARLKRVMPAAPSTVAPDVALLRRRCALRRLVLEAGGWQPDDPPDLQKIPRRHNDRLREVAGKGTEARVAAYEQTVAELGLTEKYEEMTKSARGAGRLRRPARGQR